MNYFFGIAFGVLTLTHVYILHMNRKASVKRRAFRWWLVVCGAFLAVSLALAVSDKVLLVIVLPVLGAVLFGWLRFTKFCDWCGKVVRTNLPFVDKNRCPRCGSSIS